MKTFIITLLCLLPGGSAFSCHCNNYEPFNEAIFKKYKYVAFVKIKAFTPFAISTLSAEKQSYVRTARFTADVIENYKATLPDTLLLDGYKTSCDIGLRPGDEWIILADDFHGYATVFPCGYSARYRNKDGKRDLTYNSGDTMLHQIRQFSGIREINKEGHFEAAYPNGNREYSETYRKGRLEGERLYWYPNGQLWGREVYANGVKDGPAEQWFEDGHPERREKYRAGILTDTSRSWYESNTYLPSLRLSSSMHNVSIDSMQRLYAGHPLLNSTLHDQQGNRLYSKSYYRTGRVMIESFGLPDKDVNYFIRYRESGGVEFTTLSETVPYRTGGKIDQTLVEIDYQEDGSRKGFYYDRNGRLIRRTLVKDGVETILEEKQYPEVKK